MVAGSKHAASLTAATIIGQTLSVSTSENMQFSRSLGRFTLVKADTNGLKHKEVALLLSTKAQSWMHVCLVLPTQAPEPAVCDLAE